jgi:hypothetical protein
MAFDFNLSVRFFSGGAERRQWSYLSSQGALSMNEWLDDELNELRRKKEDKAAGDKRIELLQRQTDVLWQALEPVLRDAVVKMNVDGSEFRKETGGLDYDRPTDKKVDIGRRKAGAPFVVLEVSCGPTSVSWEYRVSNTDRAVKSGLGKGHVILQVDVKQDGQPTLHQEGKFLKDELQLVVRQMLRPLIHTELLE